MVLTCAQQSPIFCRGGVQKSLKPPVEMALVGETTGIGNFCKGEVLVWEKDFSILSLLI